MKDDLQGLVLKNKPILLLNHILSLRSYALLLSLATLLVLAFSCKKDPVELGLGVQPEEDQIFVLYSPETPMTAYSNANDSVRTDETVYSLAGSYFDPVFGTSTASFYTQILLYDNDAKFGTNPQLDSMILNLAYAGSYGNPNTPVTLNIYELSEMLYYDSSYYSHQMLGGEQALDKNLLIGSFTFTPNTEDSVLVDSIMYPPHLRINLTKSVRPWFAEKILNGSALELSDNGNFVEFVKGIYITAEPATSGGSILYFNLGSELSRIDLFYSNDDEDSLQYELVLDGDCARFNHFDHDYSNAAPELRDQVNGTDTTLGAQTLYLQSMQGINVNFRIPGLEDWMNGKKVAVTRAELVLPVLGATDDYRPPSKLLLGTYDEEGELVQLADYFEGASFFGGTYDSTHMEYRFRITRHVQHILNGTEENSDLTLLVSSRSVQGNRVVIGGPERAGDAMRLELIYVPVE